MATSTGPWHILTGEYPPTPGGVADYCRQLAEALAGSGDEVHVWSGDGTDASSPSPSVHRVAGRWSLPDLARLVRSLDDFPAPRRLLVQYAPNAFGWKGMNVPFCRWLRRRRRAGDEVLILFHEVRYLERPGDSPARRLLAVVQAQMARILADAATRIYVTIPYWDRLLAASAHRPPPTTWLPVPSNVPVAKDAAAAKTLRGELGAEGREVVGTFGTFHDVIGEMVAESLPPVLLADRSRFGLLIGRGGDSLAGLILDKHPGLSGRLIATGALPADRVAIHLAACDLALQPYPDGVCSKRTTIMAALANGVACATTIGKISEPLWAESGAVALAPESDPSALWRTADSLLRDPSARATLAEAGRALYEREFGLDRLLARLKEDSALRP